MLALTQMLEFKSTSHDKFLPPEVGSLWLTPLGSIVEVTSVEEPDEYGDVGVDYSYFPSKKARGEGYKPKSGLSGLYMCFPEEEGSSVYKFNSCYEEYEALMAFANSEQELRQAGLGYLLTDMDEARAEGEK